VERAIELSIDFSKESMVGIFPTTIETIRADLDYFANVYPTSTFHLFPMESIFGVDYLVCLNKILCINKDLMQDHFLYGDSILIH
jgi:hypothetical protein